MSIQYYIDKENLKNILVNCKNKVGKYLLLIKYISNMHNKLPSHSRPKKKPLKGIQLRIPEKKFISDLSENGLDPSVAKLKVWLLLVQTPYDQRLIQNASQFKHHQRSVKPKRFK